MMAYIIKHTLTRPNTDVDFTPTLPSAYLAEASTLESSNSVSKETTYSGDNLQMHLKYTATDEATYTNFHENIRQEWRDIGVFGYLAENEISITTVIEENS
jgi:hypothetical protein